MKSILIKRVYMIIFISLTVAMAIFLLTVGIILYKRNVELRNQNVSKNPYVQKLLKDLPDLKKSADKNPTDYRSVNNYAKALYLVSYNNEAIKVYLKVVELDNSDSQAYNNLGNLYRKTSDYAKAEKSYLDAINSEPDQINAYVNLAHLYIYNLGKSEEGIKILEDLASSNPENSYLETLLEKTLMQIEENND